MSSGLTHFDESGASRMVDVSGKAETLRTARASVRVRMRRETLALIRDRAVAKGDVREVARLAGILAAKRTGDLIPLCHPIGLDAVEVAFSYEDETTLRIDASARTRGRTGVEMEAMTAASVAALTVYDMVKAVDRGVTIDALRLEEKTGGKSGPYRRTGDGDALPATEGGAER
jgi:cyclic pyranopterin monophosphate synthase